MITTPLAAPVIEATGLAKQFGSTTAVSGCLPAGATSRNRWAWSARTGPARPPPSACFSTSSSQTPGSSHFSAATRPPLCPKPDRVPAGGAWPVPPPPESSPTCSILAELKGVPRDVGLRRANALLSRLGLAEYSDRRIRELSRGLGQLVQFAVTLIHEPAFVVLDEPFSGLDPLNTRLMKDIVAERRDAGAAIMLSTHQMTDVEGAVRPRHPRRRRPPSFSKAPSARLKQRFAADEIFVVGDRVAEPIAGVTGSRRRGRRLHPHPCTRPPSREWRCGRYSIVVRGLSGSRWQHRAWRISSCASSRSIVGKIWIVARHEFAVASSRLGYRIFIASVPDPSA